MKYDYKAVEAKWQKVWEDEKTFHVEIDHKKPKFYALVEFPYPSGAGLHVGHPRSYTALDVVSRKRRQNGYNVLYPMGWDAFGLPTENFAMKNHIHPAIVTKNNVDHFRSQLKALGFSFDWDREINTTDPEYYKWTQWIFLQLYKHGLAYKKEMNVNWCTGCKCVLANEEVVNGVCERCGSEVVHRVKSQWMLKITAYADKLIDGLDGLDYIERVATQQKNWIGRSHGAEVNFGTTAGDTLTVYTTRCDTLFGATYMVVSPEHAMVKEWLDKGILKNADAVKAYQAEAARKSDFERSELNKEKTGVKLEGVMGINPVNDTEIPIFISDYVLSTYGTGAIMAVPAHDTRDWEFAKKFGLPIIEVVKGNTPSNLTDQTAALLQNYPDLKVICAPTTVGIAAAAKYLQDNESACKLTGLGLPSEMQEYTGDDDAHSCPYFYLWDMEGLGKLSAYATMALVKGDITGAEDETFTAGDMGEFTITKADDDGTEIVLGEPLQFTPDNVADYAKLY